MNISNIGTSTSSRMDREYDYKFPETYCAVCNTSNKDVGGLMMSCARCKAVHYCSVACFNADMQQHAQFCMTGKLQLGSATFAGRGNGRVKKEVLEKDLSKGQEEEKKEASSPPAPPAAKVISTKASKEPAKKTKKKKKVVKTTTKKKKAAPKPKPAQVCGEKTLEIVDDLLACDEDEATEQEGGGFVFDFNGKEDLAQLLQDGHESVNSLVVDEVSEHSHISAAASVSSVRSEIEQALHKLEVRMSQDDDSEEESSESLSSSSSSSSQLEETPCEAYQELDDASESSDEEPATNNQHGHSNDIVLGRRTSQTSMQSDNKIVSPVVSDNEDSSDSSSSAEESEESPPEHSESSSAYDEDESTVTVISDVESDSGSDVSDSNDSDDEEEDEGAEEEAKGAYKLPGSYAKSNSMDASEHSMLSLKLKETSKLVTEETMGMDRKMILMLASFQSMDRELPQRQWDAWTLLNDYGIPCQVIDGASAENKDTRDDLFEISGIRARYPQFFVVEGGSIDFFADYKMFKQYHEDGVLCQKFAQASPEEDEDKDNIGDSMHDGVGLFREAANGNHGDSDHRKHNTNAKTEENKVASKTASNDPNDDDDDSSSSDSFAAAFFGRPSMKRGNSFD